MWRRAALRATPTKITNKYQRIKRMSPIRTVLLLSAFFLSVIPGRGAAFQALEAGTAPVYLEPERYRQTMDGRQGEAEELRLKVHALAEELFMTIADSDPETSILADGLLVSTFVDLNNLYRTSSFGRYVAEQLMNEFQRYSFPVRDMRKSQSVMVQEKRGEFGLSRDPGEIPAAHSASAMLTGTYLVGEKDIMVNARILDNARGTLLSSATVVFPRNALGELLIKDASTARKQAPGVMYMKKLEM
jgi:TolB-like protein